MYKDISLNTYGNSPGAEYLCRELNKLADSVILRNVGKQITSTYKQVADLKNSYQNGFVSSKTFANCLRLMRLDVSISTFTLPCNVLIDQLRRNVQIAAIKKALRQSEIASKAYRVMQNPQKKSKHFITETKITDNNFKTILTKYYFKDKSTNRKYYLAGCHTKCEYTDGSTEEFLSVSIFNDDNVNDITSEVLHARSEARCKRLNKPHTFNKNE